MKAIVVDDEPLAVKRLSEMLAGIEDVTETVCFCDSSECLEYLDGNTADIAFLDIEMYDMNGLELAEKIKRKAKDLYIVFLTGYRNYAVDAFALKVDGYLLKPAKKTDLLREIECLKSKRYFIPQELYMRTYGKFEVFFNGKPVRFLRAKSKELIAYLVHLRGASATVGELISILYEDKPNSKSARSMIRNIMSDAKKSLAAAGFSGELFELGTNLYAVSPESFRCDSYPDGPKENGEERGYMEQYTWAESRDY